MLNPAGEKRSNRMGIGNSLKITTRQRVLYYLSRPIETPQQQYLQDNKYPNHISDINHPSQVWTGWMVNRRVDLLIRWRSASQVYSPHHVQSMSSTCRSLVHRRVVVFECYLLGQFKKHCPIQQRSSSSAWSQWCPPVPPPGTIKKQTNQINNHQATRSS